MWQLTCYNGGIVENSYMKDLSKLTSQENEKNPKWYVSEGIYS